MIIKSQLLRGLFGIDKETLQDLCFTSEVFVALIAGASFRLTLRFFFNIDVNFFNLFNVK